MSVFSKILLLYDLFSIMCSCSIIYHYCIQWNCLSFLYSLLIIFQFPMRKPIILCIHNQFETSQMILFKNFKDSKIQNISSKCALSINILMCIYLRLFLGKTMSILCRRFFQKRFFMKNT